MHPVALRTVSRTLSFGLCAHAALFAPAQSRADESASQTITIQSKAVGRTLKYRVMLPRGYEGGEERYPAIYLLHGLGGSYAHSAKSLPKNGSWRERAVVVLVDVGNSWYFNWPDSADPGAAGTVQRNQWEDYIVNELVADVDRRYRTDPSRRATLTRHESKASGRK